MAYEKQLVQSGDVITDEWGNHIQTQYDEAHAELVSHMNDYSAHGVNNLIQIDTGIVLLSASWVDDTATSGYWIYDVSDAEVDANTIVDVNVHLTSLEAASSLKPVTQSFAGYYRLYAEEQPTANITVDVRKTRQVI